jgi:very-short-patch-repair endonuclease
MKASANELAFATYLKLLYPDAPAYVTEYVFAPPRRWRFDVAWPAQRIAVELDGGVWKAGGGRHAQDGDRFKLNRAAVDGWCVLRFSTAMLEKDPVGCIEMLRTALQRRVCYDHD